MKASPCYWHGRHSRMPKNFFGYWALEAGAVAYLLDLDDSAIDHMVYPRDLVAWAPAASRVGRGSE